MEVRKAEGVKNWRGQWAGGKEGRRAGGPEGLRAEGPRGGGALGPDYLSRWAKDVDR